MHSDFPLSEPAPPAPDDGIRFWGTFASPTQEALFRERYHRQDLRQSTIALAAGFLVALAFIRTDYQILGREMFRALLWARVSFALLTLALYALLRHPWRAVTRDTFLIIWSLFGAALLFVIGLTRESQYFPGQTQTELYVILIIYLVNPLPLSWQTALAAIFTFDDAVLLFTRHMDMNFILIRATIVTYFMTNAVGFLTSRYLHRLKREQFAAFQREASLREGLETALAEVRTLRGILPICANCKRIRNDDNGWEQIESYVTHRSEAQFSHGICPDCMKSLYGR